MRTIMDDPRKKPITRTVAPSTRRNLAALARHENTSESEIIDRAVAAYADRRLPLAKTSPPAEDIAAAE